MNDYPAMIAPVNHVEPVPRRIRAFLGGEKVLDTTQALYVWEWPYYPQYYIPLADVRRDLLIPEGHTQQTGRGVTEPQELRAGEIHRPHAARLLTSSPIGGLTGTVRFDWAALDAWFEEDEQVFVHPRSPYVRVDALRSNRPVRVELDGVVLADSRSPVMVFETGLPTRYYLSRTDIDFGHLTPVDTIQERGHLVPPVCGRIRRGPTVALSHPKDAAAQLSPRRLPHPGTSVSRHFLDCSVQRGAVGGAIWPEAPSDQWMSSRRKASMAAARAQRPMMIRTA